MSKILKGLIFFFLLFFGINTTFADEYTLYYGQGCGHCYKVEKFMKKNDIHEKIEIKEKEIYFNDENRELFQNEGKSFNISNNEIGIPFLVVELDDENRFYKMGDKDIINYFESIISEKETNIEKIDTGEVIEKKEEEKGFMFFLLILIPAALSDSINPCAFAVIIILLGSILTKYKKRRKVIISGSLFTLAIFLSYYAMGIGLYNALASSTNTHILKVIVGVLGILVGIANLKDYFWYGKWFIMEVPISWRPNMKKLIRGITSPIGAFLVGIVVSLFLLPCTSGPYLTVLGYLSTHQIEGYIYLLIYNLIFILPMLIITLVIGFGFKSTAEIEELRQANLKTIHLIVGLLMLGLGMYVLLTL